MDYLEKRKKRLEVLKLIAETRLARQQLSGSTRSIEWLKGIAGLAGIITAFVALLGIYSSISRFQEEEKTKRIVQQVQQLNHSVELLADKNTGKKLAGIASVESFLRTSDHITQEQILSVLINILSVEDDKAVRDAIVSSFKSNIYKNINSNVIENALLKLTDVSRSLVIQGDLHNNRLAHPLHPPKPNSVEAKARSISKAIEIFVRYNTKFANFNGIYCVQCDFSSLIIKQAEFKNAILYLADFSSANLIRADFDGADIDHTRFVGAILQKTKFTLIEDPRPGYYRLSYINKLFNREKGKQAAVYGPNFNCSDLRDSDFSGHPVFGFSSKNATLKDGIGSPLLIFSASFVGADLEGANFSTAIMFGAKDKNDSLPFPTGSGQQSVSEYNVFEYEFSEYTFKEVDQEPYESDLGWIRRGFSGTNWDKAELPPKLSEWLNKNNPPVYMDFGIRNKCTPVSVREEFNPRLNIFERDEIFPNEL